MEKREIGAKTYLYPMPTVLVGATVGGKPNYLAVAYVGIAQHAPPMIAECALNLECRLVARQQLPEGRGAPGQGVKRGEKTQAGRRVTGLAPHRPVLIFDGECAVCRGTAEWVGRNAVPDAFEFVSCHSEELTRRFPAIERAACLQAMHLVLPDGTILIGEKAIPKILSRLKTRRYRWAASLFRLPGAEILSRAFYRWFAGRRHRIARLPGPRRH